ncbi:MAG: glycosyltransferase family 2 protein [Deltaproteobacteria bacterium]|nr:glycosyltransferase family 2 protein [Deltaproteobacteria bacterium]
MNDGKVTIAIPHFQTLELITVCLRSIRKVTPPPYEVLVIDNGSRDDSLDYLRSVKWIKLIERNGVSIRTGSWAHGSALDIGLAQTDTEFFLALHSDVFVKHPDWLKRLVMPFQNQARLACAGSGKLEEISSAYRVMKKLGDFRGMLRFVKAHVSPTGVRHVDNPPEYIRTICALYRTAILKRERLSFLPVAEREFTSGQALYYELVGKGYFTLYFSPGELRKMIDHLNHGTMVLNPSLGARSRTIASGMRRLRKKFNDAAIKSILEDSSLDR